VGCAAGNVVTAADMRYGLLIAKPVKSATSNSLVISEKGTFGFQFCELKNGEEPIDVFYRGVMMDTLYVGTIGASSKENVLTYPVAVRKNVLGYWICPKCRRADKTLEMVYGDGIPLNMASRKRPQGCIDNGTKGYCSRDRIHF
jgi:hypothetical protein